MHYKIIISRRLHAAETAADEENDFTTVSPAEALALIQRRQNLIILDASPLDQWTNPVERPPAHFPFPFKWFPYPSGGFDGEAFHRFDAFSQSLGDLPILVICRSGNKSVAMAAMLAEERDKVFSLEGGLAAWSNEKTLPSAIHWYDIIDRFTNTETTFEGFSQESQAIFKTGDTGRIVTINGIELIYGEWKKISRQLPHLRPATKASP